MTLQRYCKRCLSGSNWCQNAERFGVIAVDRGLTGAISSHREREIERLTSAKRLSNNLLPVRRCDKLIRVKCEYEITASAR